MLDKFAKKVYNNCEFIIKGVYTELIPLLLFIQRDGGRCEPFEGVYGTPSVQLPQEMADVSRVKVSEKFLR